MHLHTILSCIISTVGTILAGSLHDSILPEIPHGQSPETYDGQMFFLQPTIVDWEQTNLSPIACHYL